MRRIAAAVAVLLPLFAACVSPVDPLQEPGWVSLEPGEGISIAFDGADGELDGISMAVPAQAVTQATAIRFSVPALTEPVFFEAGMQLRTPVVAVEPFNQIFAVPVEMKLPWYAFGETIAADQARGWVSDGILGVPEGLWDVTDTTADFPATIAVQVLRGGYYWAGTWEDEPSRTPATVIGDPCVVAEFGVEQLSGLDACADDGECVASGCLGEFCGQALDLPTSCRPSLLTEMRFGCACRCSPGLCQWVQ